MPDVTMRFGRALEWIPINKPIARVMRVAVQNYSDRSQLLGIGKAAAVGIIVDSMPTEIRLDPHERRELLVPIRGRLTTDKRLPFQLWGVTVTGTTFETGFQSIERDYLPLVQGLRALPMPVVCAVNGVAAGAGANIALACDIVVAARSASFIQAFCRIGLVPDSGGTWFLPRLVGSARAAGLALLGDKLPADEAASWGLIWQCVDDAELAPTVERTAAQLAQASPRGLAAIKRALQAGAANSLDAQLALERDLQRELGFGADYREGVAAFLEKRAPRFGSR